MFDCSGPLPQEEHRHQKNVAKQRSENPQNLHPGDIQKPWHLPVHVKECPYLEEVHVKEGRESAPENTVQQNIHLSEGMVHIRPPNETLPHYKWPFYPQNHI